MCECLKANEGKSLQEPKSPIGKCMGEGNKDGILDCKRTRSLQSETEILYCNTNIPQLSCSSLSTSSKIEEEPLQSPNICLSPGIESEFKLGDELNVECTLAIIKPEAVKFREEIMRRIYKEDFNVYQTRMLLLTPEQASEFYCDGYGQTNFAHLVAYMSSGPIVALVLAKLQAIDEWRTLIGPTKVTEARLYYPDSIRAQFGRNEDFKNAVHGSKNGKEAEREIHFFFPDFVLENIPSGKMIEDYLCKVINSVLTKGLSECCKVRPADPILWLAHWLLTNNPYKPKMSKELMIIPT